MDFRLAAMGGRAGGGWKGGWAGGWVVGTHPMSPSRSRRSSAASSSPAMWNDATEPSEGRAGSRLVFLIFLGVRRVCRESLKLTSPHPWARRPPRRPPRGRRAGPPPRMAPVWRLRWHRLKRNSFRRCAPAPPCLPDDAGKKRRMPTPPSPCVDLSSRYPPSS